MAKAGPTPIEEHMKTLLIDGDILVYEHACAVEKAFEWEPGQFTYTADVDLAWEQVQNAIQRLKAQAKADDVKVALSHPENFRKAIYPPYKAPRKSARKPLALAPLRAKLLEGGAYMRPALEADDVLGILGTSRVLTGRKIIWSTDKDLLQVPGLHLRDGAVVEVTLDDADYRHATQTLTGDRVDNYPGLRGCGPKKAEAIIFGNSPGWGTRAEMWAAIEKAFGDRDEMLVQARVARILRGEDFDFTTKRPILWNPPKE
jgi:DNA polymerase-1